MFGNSAVVLDGASSYPADARTRDGGWYARTLLATLGFRLRDSGSLTDCLADAITTMRDSEAVSQGGPSSTVLMARINPDTVEVLVLGDSTLIVEQATGAPVEICDNRLQGVATEQRGTYRARLAEGAGFSTGHSQRLAQLQDAERAVRNQEGGYWIAESEPAAARQALTRTFPRTQVGGLLLLTDGAAAAVTRYSTPSCWADLLQRIDHGGISATLAGIHLIEQTDPDGQRWPRSKPHDDKTALRLRLPR